LGHGVDTMSDEQGKVPERTEMAKERDKTRLPDASEDRIIECSVCSSAMSTMEAEGVTVDVCAGGCGGIWFDWFELARVDEVHESAGEKFLEVERDPVLRPDLSRRIRCPRDGEIMMRHFHSVKRGVLVDECPRCAGFWLDVGELASIRSEFATQEEREKAAQEYFSELFDPDLAVERAKTMEDLRKARRIAYAFRFICPSYYIPGEHSKIAFQHAPAFGCRLSALQHFSLSTRAGIDICPCWATAVGVE
jgi:Zn-finger nucleic acid-binding protein